MNNKLKEIIDELNQSGNKVIFVTKFGSHLYGTNTPESDTDYKGVFVPNIDDIILQKPLRHYTYSTGERHTKNSNTDIDIQFYSIYKLINDVYKGDINGLDLLFAYTNQQATIYKHHTWNRIVKYIKPLISKNMMGLKGYILRQARMYGIKGSRLHDLIKFRDILEKIDKDKKIEELINIIDFNEFEYIKIWYELNTNKISGIEVLDKKYQNYRTIEFVLEQVNNLINNYGKRSRKAMNDNFVDYKALSHAYRAAIQMKMLLKTGEIQFPFKDKDLEEIMKIKNKQYSLKEALKLIEDIFDYLDSIKDKCNILQESIDPKLKDEITLKIIKQFYMWNTKI